MAEAVFRLRTTGPHPKHLPVLLVGLCLPYNLSQDQRRLTSQETDTRALSKASTELSSSACTIFNDPSRNCIITIVPNFQTEEKKRLRLRHIQREAQEQASMNWDAHVDALTLSQACWAWEPPVLFLWYFYEHPLLKVEDTHLGNTQKASSTYLLKEGDL